MDTVKPVIMNMYVAASEFKHLFYHFDKYI